MDEEVIELSDTPPSPKRPRVPSPSSSLEIVSSRIADEVELVSHTTREERQQNLEVEVENVVESGEELAVTGVKEGVNVLADYPHFRFQCATERFEVPVSRGCAKCFCYVCDKVTRDCTMWVEHCLADDRGIGWRQLRMRFSGRERGFGGGNRGRGFRRGNSGNTGRGMGDTSIFDVMQPRGNGVEDCNCEFHRRARERERVGRDLGREVVRGAGRGLTRGVGKRRRGRPRGRTRGRPN